MAGMPATLHAGTLTVDTVAPESREAADADHHTPP